MRKLILIPTAWFLWWYMLSLMLVTPAYAEKIPALSEIPADLPDSSRVQLYQRKQALEKDLANFQAAAAKFNAKDAKDQSDSEYEALDAWRTRYINAAKEFNKAVAETQVTENNASRLRAVSVQPGVANPAQLRGELLEPLSDAILKRTAQPNEQAQEIMRSFKTGEVPSPVKNIANLAPGDVILVAPVPMKDRLRDETKQHLKDVIISNGINFLDRWGSDNWSSPASHAAIFLGERNGKRWYLDNTSSHGPVIKEEAEFLKEYGQRKMDVATLVGQPLSQREGQELWKGAHELRNSTTYGIWFDDKMVCSETSRWLLVRAGRAVPETQSKDKNYDLIVDNLKLNKKQFVNFSPSDFYENQQYFVIHELGMQSVAEKKP